jgi:hypothetical protein
MLKKLFAGAVLVGACVGFFVAAYLSGGKDALISFGLGIIIGCAMVWAMNVLLAEGRDG